MKSEKQELKHVYKKVNSSGKGHRNYTLTLTNFAGEIYATITSRSYSPSGYPEAGTSQIHIQNKILKSVPKKFDIFIESWI